MSHISEYLEIYCPKSTYLCWAVRMQPEVLLVMFCVILCLCLCITMNLSSDCYCNLMSFLGFLASHSFGCLPDCYTSFSRVACSRDPRMHFLCNICYAGFYLYE
jgi:hypothetical protein